jgi:hypothetical protein
MASEMPSRRSFKIKQQSNGCKAVRVPEASLGTLYAEDDKR